MISSQANNWSYFTILNTSITYPIWIYWFVKYGQRALLFVYLRMVLGMKEHWQWMAYKYWNSCACQCYSRNVSFAVCHTYTHTIPCVANHTLCLFMLFVCSNFVAICRWHLYLHNIKTCASFNGFIHIYILLCIVIHSDLRCM